MDDLDGMDDPSSFNGADELSTDFVDNEEEDLLDIGSDLTLDMEEYDSGIEDTDGAGTEGFYFDESEEDGDDELDLDVLESPVPEVYSEPLVYPCMILKGVDTIAEVLFLRKIIEESDVSLPLYCLVDGSYQKIGLSELTVQYLQILKYVGNYVVEIHKNESSVVELDLNSPDTYYNFMTL
jgi:hypothetical protein